ncbi:uncharacterized protein LOC141614215 [Silene latifolia]|uniref:uncharacterized protein LOC141614215 n=1 Tax=Silene latifolia TaxID=37657 RepID=UPI003D77E057
MQRIDDEDDSDDPDVILSEGDFDDDSDDDLFVEAVDEDFPTNNVLRKALRHHSVENGYDYYLLHNGSKRVSVLAKEGVIVFGNKKCIALYLAEKYLDYWRLDSTTNIEKFQRQVMTDLGVDITYWKAYYAKHKALKMIYGESGEQYKRVWDYAETLKKFNVGSSVFVKLTNIDRPPPVFQRMYVCLEACKAGFIAVCRPILGVDGCHLKGPYPGMLLVAVWKDGNCNIYPVAWAIVEVENTATWIWFLELLIKDLQALGENITFISDRQKGLLEAFNKVVPYAEIRFCCRHIWANFKLSFPGGV